MRDGRDVYIWDGLWEYSWCRVRSGIKETIRVVDERVKGTLNVLTPGFGITTVAATTRLLCDKEADVVVLVMAGTETATTKDTAVVECTVSGRMLGRRRRVRETECSLASETALSFGEYVTARTAWHDGVL